MSTAITCSTRGRHTALQLHLTSDDWYALQATQQQPPIGRRARIVLLRAEGWNITTIARTVGLSRMRVYKWLKRWQQAGLAGLESQRAGRKPRGDS